MFIDLLPENRTKLNASEAYQSVDEAAQSLTAALASHALIPPLPVAQLWSAKDPNEILPGQVPLGPPDKQHFFRAKDAIALYICFCTLAGGTENDRWRGTDELRFDEVLMTHLPEEGLGLLCSDGLEAFTPAAGRGVYPSAQSVRGPGLPDQPVAFHSAEATPRTANLRHATKSATDNCPAAALTSELTATMRSCDGLHPITTEALTKLEHIVRNSQVLLQQQQQRQQQNLLKRSYSAIDAGSMQAYSFQPVDSGGPSEARAFLPPSRGCSGGVSGAVGTGGEKLQHQECFVTTRNPLNGETILHLAARMNVGARAIRRLCGSLVAEEGTASDPTLALLCLDKDGRSPLTASAATDGIETTTALYRLEREAITCSRSHASAASGAGGEGGAEKPAESRRRTRHIEIRRSTPLMVSLKAGCSEVTKLLLDEGCSIQGVDETGRNLVHWAAVLNAAPLLIRISHTKGFTRMLEARDDCDRTPLMLAVRENSLEAAQILLEHQAAIDVYDYTDSCPIDEAKARGFTRMLALLMEYKQRRSLPGSRLAGSASRQSSSKDLPGSTPSSSSSTTGDGADEEEGTGGNCTGSEMGALGSSSGTGGGGGGSGGGVGDSLTFQSPNQPFSSAYATPSQVSSPQQEERAWQQQQQQRRTDGMSDLLLEKPKFEDQHASPLQGTWSPASKEPSPPSSSSTASSYWQPHPPGSGLVKYGNPVDPAAMTYNYNQIGPMGDSEPQFPAPYSLATAEMTTPPVYNQLPLANGYSCPSGTNSSTNSSSSSSSHSAAPDQQCFQLGGSFKYAGGVPDFESTKPVFNCGDGAPCRSYPQNIRHMSPMAATGFMHPADPTVAEDAFGSPKAAHMVAPRSGRGYLMGRSAAAAAAAAAAATPVDIRGGQSTRGMFVLQL
nr:unnamed protein product [Spirometra erinaceieuropaei]